MPHSQPTALQQIVCKFHLDPQYNISHWGSTILGDSTLWMGGDGEYSGMMIGGGDLMDGGGDYDAVMGGNGVIMMDGDYD